MTLIAEGCLPIFLSTHECLITFHYIFYIAPSPHPWQTNIHTRAVAGATICQQSRKKSCESHCRSVFSKNQSCARSKFRTSSAQFTHHKGLEQNVGDSTDWHLGCEIHLSVTWASHHHCVSHKVWQHCEILHWSQGARHCYNIGCLHKPGIN